MVMLRNEEVYNKLAQFLSEEDRQKLEQTLSLSELGKILLRGYAAMEEDIAEHESKVIEVEEEALKEIKNIEEHIEDTNKAAYDVEFLINFYKTLVKSCTGLGYISGGVHDGLEEFEAKRLEQYEYIPDKEEIDKDTFVDEDQFSMVDAIIGGVKEALEEATLKEHNQHVKAITEGLEKIGIERTSTESSSAGKAKAIDVILRLTRARDLPSEVAEAAIEEIIEEPEEDLPEGISQEFKDMCNQTLSDYWHHESVIETVAIDCSVSEIKYLLSNLSWYNSTIYKAYQKALDADNDEVAIYLANNYSPEINSEADILEKTDKLEKEEADRLEQDLKEAIEVERASMNGNFCNIQVEPLNKGSMDLEAFFTGPEQPLYARNLTETQIALTIFHLGDANYNCSYSNVLIPMSNEFFNLTNHIPFKYLKESIDLRTLVTKGKLELFTQEEFDQINQEVLEDSCPEGVENCSQCHLETECERDISDDSECEREISDDSEWSYSWDMPYFSEDCECANCTCDTKEDIFTEENVRKAIEKSLAFGSYFYFRSFVSNFANLTEEAIDDGEARAALNACDYIELPDDQIYELNPRFNFISQSEEIAIDSEMVLKAAWQASEKWCRGIGTDKDYFDLGGFSEIISKLSNTKVDLKVAKELLETHEQVAWHNFTMYVILEEGEVD